MPVLFAALLDANGQKGPAEIPAKRAYLFKDCVRLAHGFGVPFAPPPAHPFKPLLALRVTSLPMPAEARRALCNRLFAATWGGGRGVRGRRRSPRPRAPRGSTATRWWSARPSPRPRTGCAGRPSEALAAGAFGVPTMLANGELFWGVDALPHLEAFLDGRDPVTPGIVARWAELPAAAQRPRSRG